MSQVASKSALLPGMEGRGPLIGSPLQAPQPEMTAEALLGALSN